MSDIEEQKQAARADLFYGARLASRYGKEPMDWLDTVPQWALDLLPQREIDAIVAYIWGEDET